MPRIGEIGGQIVGPSIIGPMGPQGFPGLSGRDGVQGVQGVPGPSNPLWYPGFWQAAAGATSPWTLVVNENGSSFTNWANDTGSWSSNGTVFLAAPGTATPAKMRYTPAIFTAPLIVDYEVYFDSTGAGQANGQWCGACLGNSSQPSGGPFIGLFFTSNNPAATGKVYAEAQSLIGYNGGPANVFALDTWITIRTLISAASSIWLYKAGTLLWGTHIAVTAGSTYTSLTIYCYETKVQVRNIKAYQLTSP